MPYRLCGSDCNPLPSSLGGQLPSRGPPKLHRAEPHPWSEEGGREGITNQNSLGREEQRAASLPPQKVRALGALQVRGSGNWGGKTSGTLHWLQSLCPIPAQASAPVGLIFGSCEFVLVLLLQKQKSFCRSPLPHHQPRGWRFGKVAGPTEGRSGRSLFCIFYNCKWMSNRKNSAYRNMQKTNHSRRSPGQIRAGGSSLLPSHLQHPSRSPSPPAGLAGQG